MDESERYIWDFDLFLILLILTLMGGIMHNTGGVLGVGTTHLVRCGECCICLEIMPKIHFIWIVT